MNLKNDDLTELEQQKIVVEQKLLKLIANLEWSLHNIQKAIDSCLGWQEAQHQLVLLQSNLYRYKPGMEMLVVEDWENDWLKQEIKLNPLLSIGDQVNAKARQVKKWQRGLEPLKLRKAKIGERHLLLIEAMMALKDIGDIKALALFKEQYFFKKISKHSSRKLKPYRVFWTRSGLRILVGKGARSNGFVTFSLSAGSDIWCHAQGYAGAHVVLQIQKGREPDSEALKDALQLALFHSKAGECSDVIVSNVKYLRPLGKKESGKVQVSKHSVQRVHVDAGRLRELQERTSLAQPTE